MRRIFREIKKYLWKNVLKEPRRLNIKGKKVLNEITVSMMIIVKN